MFGDTLWEITPVFHSSQLLQNFSAYMGHISPSKLPSITSCLVSTSDFFSFSQCDTLYDTFKGNTVDAFIERLDFVL